MHKKTWYCLLGDMIKMVELTEVQQTLLEQLRGLNMFFISECNVKTILAIDNGLRLHTKNNGRVVNIDITYDYGNDLYDIKAYSVNSLKAECEQIADFTGVFFDQLHELIREILFKEAS